MDSYTFEQLGVVILGAGRAGRRHALAARRVPEVNLLGFYDICSSAAQDLAAEFDAHAFQDLTTAWDQPGACLAIISTPPATHRDMALAALEAGFHVLVEKPFSLDLDSVYAVEQAAAQQGLFAGAVSQHRFSPDAGLLYREIRCKAWGEVLSVKVHVQRHRPVDYFRLDPQNWRLQRPISGGGVLITVGFHYLDLACWLFGSPTDAQAHIESQHNGIESSIVGTFRLGHIPASIEARWGDLPNTGDVLRIQTTQRTLEYIGDRLVQHGSSEPPDRIDLHARQLYDLARGIQLGQPPSIAPADVAPTLGLIFDLYNSALVVER